MKKRMLFEQVNFGGLTNKIGGKIVLSAVDFDFEMEVYRLAEVDGKKSFVEPYAIALQKKEILEIKKGVLESFIAAFNRVKFNVKELQPNHVFADIKFITRGMNAIRLTGRYVDSEGRKNRRTTMKIYKLEGWDQVKLFNNDSDAFEANVVATFEFEPVLVSRGSFVYKDMLAIEEMSEIMGDCYYKRNTSYSLFLEEVGKSNAEGAASYTSKSSSTTNSGNNGYQQHYKPKTVVEDDAEGGFDENEFPF